MEDLTYDFFDFVFRICFPSKLLFSMIHSDSEFSFVVANKINSSRFYFLRFVYKFLAMNVQPGFLSRPN